MGAQPLVEGFSRGEWSASPEGLNLGCGWGGAWLEWG